MVASSWKLTKAFSLRIFLKKKHCHALNSSVSQYRVSTVKSAVGCNCEERKAKLSIYKAQHVLFGILKAALHRFLFWSGKVRTWFVYIVFKAKACSVSEWKTDKLSGYCLINNKLWEILVSLCISIFFLIKKCALFSSVIAHLDKKISCNVGLCIKWKSLKCTKT